MCRSVRPFFCPSVFRHGVWNFLKKNISAHVILYVSWPPFIFVFNFGSLVVKYLPENWAFGICWRKSTGWTYLTHLIVLVGHVSWPLLIFMLHQSILTLWCPIVKPTNGVGRIFYTWHSTLRGESHELFIYMFLPSIAAQWRPNVCSKGGGKILLPWPHSGQNNAVIFRKQSFPEGPPPV